MSVTIYHRVAAPESWREDEGMSYIDANLRSALDNLDRLDQLFQSSSKGKDGVGELLEVRIVRRVDDSGCERPGCSGSGLGVADICHGDSPSVVLAGSVSEERAS